MIGSWRWFDPLDRIGLDEIARTGASSGNDVLAIARRFVEEIDFAHLRNVAREPEGTFQEADHLGGDTDMVDLVAALRAEQRRRLDEGAAEAEIPFRPDHGHAIGPDLGRGTRPGYPLVGRLCGLAVLRGVLKALDHPKVSHA